MLQQLQGLLGALNPPSHPHVGEAFFAHKSLKAYYFLRAKCSLYEHHARSPGLKEFWADGLASVEERIAKLETVMDHLGIPKPASVPVSAELTDQFMLLDGMAMVQGMLVADVIGIQSVQRAELVSLYKEMMDAAMTFGARILAVAEHEGWTVTPPAYDARPVQ